MTFDFRLKVFHTVARRLNFTRAAEEKQISVLAALFFRTGKQKIKIPYFIGAFVLATVLNTYLRMPVVSQVLDLGFCVVGSVAPGGVTRKKSPEFNN